MSSKSKVKSKKRTKNVANDEDSIPSETISKIDVSKFKAKAKTSLESSKTKNTEKSTKTSNRKKSSKTNNTENSSKTNNTEESSKNTEKSNKTSNSKGSSKTIKKPKEITNNTKDADSKITNKERTMRKRAHIKIGSTDDETSSSSDIDTNNKDKKTAKLMPKNWEIVLENIREMRKNRDATVDSMGYDKCPDKNASPEVFRYQTLVALMLSSQTKEQVTFAAMERLKEHGCTIENILATSDKTLGDLIFPVGFWKMKVKYIKETTEVLKSKYNGDIPRSIAELCKLKGVGPKMAHICMKGAWNEISGIGVDTHVHRISNRLGWVKTKTPEETRKALENWLPFELWGELSQLIIGFGQTICSAAKPDCASCKNKKICPIGIKSK